MIRKTVDSINYDRLALCRLLLSDILSVELGLLLMSTPVIDGHSWLGLLQCLQHLDILLIDLLNLLLALSKVESTRYIRPILVPSSILVETLWPSFQLIYKY